jgi:hypothetical protein
VTGAQQPLGGPAPWWTVEQAHDWLMGKLEKGASCPCCGQHAQQYGRRVSASMVRTMGRMLGAGADRRYVHLPDIRQGSRDVATCRYFGLIEQESARRPDGGRTGWWRLTERGIGFLEGNRPVRKYALVYDGLCVGFDGPMITVAEVAPAFDLREAKGER